MTDLFATAKAKPQDYAHGISFTEALFVWSRVAILSFGGPARQIAVMHRIIVEEKNWISEGHFLHALNYCMLLPGPEAQQLATYIGWLLHRTTGGIVAGGLFVLAGVAGARAVGRSGDRDLPLPRRNARRAHFFMHYRRPASCSRRHLMRGATNQS
jgi:hypothetical protein